MKYTFFNRDLSWLRFNARVLQEAQDKQNPLFERIKFLAIYSSNLDEFFKVRVSDIRQIKNLDKELRKKLITKPNKLLKEIKQEVNRQGQLLGNIFRNEIIPELNALGIHIVSTNEISGQYKDFAIDFIENKLKEPLVIKDNFSTEEECLFIENEKLYLITAQPEGGIMCVKVPEESRFIELPSEDGHKIAYIDDILKVYLKETYDKVFFELKVSRDAELYIEDEYSGNLLDKIKNSLSNRNVGQITRALIDAKVDKATNEQLQTVLDINDTDIVYGGENHKMKDFFGFPNPIGDVLEHKKLPPIDPDYIKTGTSVFSVIKEKERMLHFPFESYDGILKWIEEAAEDKEVTVIKITLYRVSSDSKIAKALLRAVENGKKVFVFIETKARFDEENNIKWGKRLEDAGARVRYSFPGIKVHSKILYIEKGATNEKFAYIGTGNFNEKTASIYTDFGLLTARTALTEEVRQVFSILEGELIVPKIKNLLVSPFTSRTSFTKLVDKEIKKVKQGMEGFIFLKLNSIEDHKMIKHLYKASNEGVKIRLIVRGICCLVPGIKGQSENIEVVSIIDRFLEHSRVYIFGSGDEEKMFIGSADWMTRNIDHRIEVVAPVVEKENSQIIRDIMQMQWEDNVKGRMIDADQTNEVFTNRSSYDRGSQERIYDYLKEKNRKD
ncbi:polyphosphate kinase 1 [Flammeovirga aprica]|uniref:Polyphosphate kinase n=1 Tax=Flammeovirga aprica JL-4 TaxID=694437 RepID=A0A7X9P126_9BACT|nr:polyphosphate kinase 1 [Flammeovirga aprica]NME66719.1 polyphosphate kinase 1 [Flammeovirga aprica JL-4]